jgi:hypothetical protein
LRFFAELALVWLSPPLREATRREAARFIMAAYETTLALADTANKKIRGNTGSSLYS